MNPHGYDVRTGKFARGAARPQSVKAGAGVCSSQTSTGQVFSVRRQKRKRTKPAFFQLIKASTKVSGTTTDKVRVVRSTFDGSPPDFPTANTPFVDGDNPHCVFTVTASGVLYGHATIDHAAATAAEAVTSVEFAFGAAKPDDTDTEKYVLVGSWSLDTDTHRLICSNDIYGPIIIKVCREWGVNPKHYGIDFLSSGMTE